MMLADLHNPQDIRAILLDSGAYVEADDDQGWQEYPGSVELWQMLDGQLLRIQRWLKTSIARIYAGKEQGT